MKKLFVFLFVVAALLSMTACGEDSSAVPAVALTDVAADAVPDPEIVPADISEVAVASEEMILVQPAGGPMDQPASGEPADVPSAEDASPADGSDALDTEE